MPRGEMTLWISSLSTRILPVLFDTSVIIDYLQGHRGAEELLDAVDECLSFFHRKLMRRKFRLVLTLGI